MSEQKRNLLSTLIILDFIPSNNVKYYVIPQSHKNYKQIETICNSTNNIFAFIPRDIDLYESELNENIIKYLNDTKKYSYYIQYTKKKNKGLNCNITPLKIDQWATFRAEKETIKYKCSPLMALLADMEEFEQTSIIYPGFKLSKNIDVVYSIKVNIDEAVQYGQVLINE